MTTSELVDKFGESRRKVIEESVRWLDENEPKWGLSVLIDRESFIRNLLEKEIQEAEFFPTKFMGVALECDKPTPNGNVYPRSLMESVVEKYRNKHVFPGPALGWLVEDLADGEYRLANASHVIRDVQWKGNQLVVAIETLDTEKGKKLAEWIKKGKARPMTEGTGSIGEDRVVKDLTLTSISFEELKETGNADARTE